MLNMSFFPVSLDIKHIACRHIYNSDDGVGVKSQRDRRPKQGEDTRREDRNGEMGTIYFGRHVVEDPSCYHYY